MAAQRSESAKLLDPIEGEAPEPERDWGADAPPSFNMGEMFRGLSYELENLGPETTSADECED